MGTSFGTVPENHWRGFINLGYNIPIVRLVKGRFYVHKIDPEPIDGSKAFNF